MNNPICPNCGIVLLPKEEGPLVFVECSACRYRKEYKDWVEQLCPKCGHYKAIVILNQMVLGDEDWVTIYKCINCGYSYKEGFKG